MKTNKLVTLTTVTVLTSMITLSATSALATEEWEGIQSVTTEGEITFETDDESETEVVPPVDPEVPIVVPPVEPETNTGPFTIAYVPTMGFGTQTITAHERTYNMLAEWFDTEDGTSQKPYISFAQVQDTRGAYDGWNLKVSMSEFVTTDDAELHGASINFLNHEIDFNQDQGEQTTKPDGYNFELVPGGEAQVVMSADQGAGAGVSSIIWGDYDAIKAADAEGETDIENEDIQLVVPVGAGALADTYTATLSWELQAGPANAL